MEELEASWHESRKNECLFFHPSFKLLVGLIDLSPAAESKGIDSEDLLFANPNHGIIPGEGSSDEEEEESVNTNDSFADWKGPPPSPPESESEDGAAEEQNKVENIRKGKEAAKV